MNENTTSPAEAIQALCERARASGRDSLLETEGMTVLRAMGIVVPDRVFVKSSEQVSKVRPLSGPRVVVKIISPAILHKSDVGGVKVVSNTAEEITRAIADMEARLSAHPIEGFTINECVSFEPGPASEVLFGIRYTEDFGPVVTVGSGGVYTEFLAKHFESSSAIAIFSPLVNEPDAIRKGLEKLAITKLVTQPFRGQAPKTTLVEMAAMVSRFLEFAKTWVPREICEFEVNPMVATKQGWIALDCLVKLTPKQRSEEIANTEARAKARPVEKIRNLLEPRSVGVVGVSEKMNPGRIILGNLIREGFDRSKISVIKPGTDSIDGCKCVPEIKSLPEKVDLLVLAVSAQQVPDLVTEVIEHEKAESIIVIPGGLEEKEGAENVARAMHNRLDVSRASKWKGPVINGGNCLGIKSLPGRYDTMFIPDYKVQGAKGAVSPLALISQSGAFAISRANKLSMLNPKYSISLGNQTDLTIGDYLQYLRNDSTIDVFAVYVEGFRAGDGQKFLMAAKAITSGGRKVILYRAGRTAAGAQASASHTASIAGDWAVTRELCEAAGVTLATSLADFDDLVRSSVFLREKRARGLRLGAVSNAGFECVAIADSLGDMVLSQLTSSTRQRLSEIFKEARLDGIVDVHNPLDLTPMASDATYEKVVRVLLEDDTVDIGLVACIPLTPALNTLGAGEGHAEDVTEKESIVGRLVRIRGEIDKPWIAVVGAGPLYDQMAEQLEKNGIPVCRTVDQGTRILEKLIKSHR